MGIGELLQRGTRDREALRGVAAARGAFVISLDFELHWGVRDHVAEYDAYRANLLGERSAIPRMLDLFAEYDVAATWATVGFLFAESKDELTSYFPRVRPAYDDRALDPYPQPVGESEKDDPLHYAPSMIRAIQATPRQEIGSHTFSHYYCLAAGQTHASFRDDLASAVRIAASRGVTLRSIVFPRNQANPAYHDDLVAAGFRAYRGTERAWMYAPTAREGLARRAVRLADSYLDLSGANITRWKDVVPERGIVNVPSSRFLRPYSSRLDRAEPLRLRRIQSALRTAARRGGIFHLWWHPHNFGVNTEANIAFLRRVLETYKEERDARGMESLAMGQIADRVLAR